MKLIKVLILTTLIGTSLPLYAYFTGPIDDTIEDSIQSQIILDGQLDYLDLDISVAKGNVKVDGEAKNNEDRDKVIKIINLTPGVVRIDTTDFQLTVPE